CVPPPASQPYPPSLHDALPILSFSIDFPVSLAATRWSALIAPCSTASSRPPSGSISSACIFTRSPFSFAACMYLLDWSMENTPRSEEHTSELQSRFDLVCRLLL